MLPDERIYVIPPGRQPGSDAPGGSGGGASAGTTPTPTSGGGAGAP
jgi:hypothetical protein